MVYHREFESWLEFIQKVEWLKREAVDGVHNGLRCNSILREDPSWTGTRTLNEAIDLAYDGWPKGREFLTSLRDKISIEKLLPHSRRIIEECDVSGDEPNIDLFLAGEPEHMSTLIEPAQREGGKLVRIAVNRSVTHRVYPQQIGRKGMAILLAMETLIMLGYSLELTIVVACRNDYREVHEFTVPVLHAGDPISLDTFAFMLMHTAVHRRLSFAVKETESREIRERFEFHSGGDFSSSCEPRRLGEYDLVLKWDEGLLDYDSEVVPLALSFLKRVGIDTSQAV
jgi:hypothetical protein